ncbi:MAG: T9SS type A sorting domain-containing protein [Sporocytophaga sp.]|uniref:PKD-like domain-containing protein n=1 Tax=Sporocytophaga sp. TaxID=2231183 RepID=UPI001B184463|nr:PKD-like domain-containing protein [Sporocytophaga sp.]MBO9702606.1 T9SS type A sorting domain-containing protein [Sporocytophaga sp.]
MKLLTFCNSKFSALIKRVIFLQFVFTAFINPSFCQTPDSWTKKNHVGFNKPDAPLSRFGAVGFSINNKGYIGAGKNDNGNQIDFWEYDPITNVWTQKADFIGGGRYNAVGFSISNKGYVGTGNAGLGVLYDNQKGFKVKDFYEYDPVTNQWTQKADFAGEARQAAVGFAIGDKGYIGTGTNGNPLNDFWEYNPSTDTWSKKKDFPGKARFGACGFAIQNKGYLGSGNIGDNIEYDDPEKVSDFWEYDPTLDMWTQKADVGGDPKHFATGISAGNKGYVSGGDQYIWEFDPASNTWEQKVDLGYIFEYGAGFSIEGKLYQGTGYSSIILNEFIEYDPNKNAVTRKTNLGNELITKSVGFSILNKGYIGTGFGFRNYKEFWEYDPQTGYWTQKADFAGDGRTSAVGFSIGDKGYIGTGLGSVSTGTSDIFMKDFWEYNPATNVWTRKKDFPGAGRYEAVGFSINNKGYIGTGTINGNFEKDFWEYDPAKDEWTKKKDFGGGIRTEAVGFSINNKGYIGTGIGTMNHHKDFWEYDPAIDNWIQKANFKGTGRSGAVGFNVGNKGYIGTGDDPYSQSDFYEFDPANNTWTRKADFPDTRWNAIGFGIGNKGFLGTGGAHNDDMGDFWQYNPSELYINSLNSATFCKGSPIEVKFATGKVLYNTDNVYNVELSDVSGSFNSPLLLGTLNSGDSSGVIKAEIPQQIISSNSYKIRIVSSHPSFVKEFENQIVIENNNAPVVANTILRDTVCSKVLWNGVQLTSIEPSVSFKWKTLDNPFVIVPVSYGNGNIPSQTFSTSDDQLREVNFQILPYSTCPGKMAEYIVTVRPTPWVSFDYPMEDLICSGQMWPTSSMNLQPNNVTFKWSLLSTNGVSGYLTESEGEIPPHKLLNTGATDANVIYQLRVEDDYCSSLPINFKVTVDVCTDLKNEKLNQESYSVSPNPFTDFTVLKMNGEDNLMNYSILLFDSQGNKVLEIPDVKTKEVLIERGNLHDGIYYYQVINKNQQAGSGKIVIRN